MRLIDADSLKETIEYISFETGYDAEKVINAIDEEPTVVNMKCGIWYCLPNNIQRCSECGFYEEFALARFAYCPRCGAKMSGE